MDEEIIANDKKNIERKYVFVVVKDKNNNYVYISLFERVAHNREISAKNIIEDLYLLPGISITNREYNQIREVINDYLLEKKGSAYTISVSVISGEIHIDKCIEEYDSMQKAAEIITTYPIKKVCTKLNEGLLLSDIVDDKTSIEYATQEPSVDFYGLYGKIKKGNKIENRLSISSTIPSLIMKFFATEKISMKGLSKIFVEENKVGFIFRKAIQEIKDFYEYMSPERMSPQLLMEAKEYGFSDEEIAKACKTISKEITAIRYGNDIFPNFRQIDNSRTGNYFNNKQSYFSSYKTSNELEKTKENRVLLSNNMDEIVEKSDIINFLYIESNNDEMKERINQFVYKNY